MDFVSRFHLDASIAGGGPVEFPLRRLQIRRGGDLVKRPGARRSPWRPETHCALEMDCWFGDIHPVAMEIVSAQPIGTGGRLEPGSATPTQRLSGAERHAVGQRWHGSRPPEASQLLRDLLKPGAEHAGEEEQPAASLRLPESPCMSDTSQSQLEDTFAGGGPNSGPGPSSTMSASFAGSMPATPFAPGCPGRPGQVLFTVEASAPKSAAPSSMVDMAAVARVHEGLSQSVRQPVDSTGIPPNELSQVEVMSLLDALTCLLGTADGGTSLPFASVSSTSSRSPTERLSPSTGQAGAIALPVLAPTRRAIQHPTPATALLPVATSQPSPVAVDGCLPPAHYFSDARDQAATRRLGPLLPFHQRQRHPICPRRYPAAIGRSPAVLALPRRGLARRHPVPASSSGPRAAMAPSLAARADTLSRSFRWIDPLVSALAARSASDAGLAAVPGTSPADGPATGALLVDTATGCLLVNVEIIVDMRDSPPGQHIAPDPHIHRLRGFLVTAVGCSLVAPARSMGDTPISSVLLADDLAAAQCVNLRPAHPHHGLAFRLVRPTPALTADQVEVHLLRGFVAHIRQLDPDLLCFFGDRVQMLGPGAGFGWACERAWARFGLNLPNELARGPAGPVSQTPLPWSSPMPGAQRVPFPRLADVRVAGRLLLDVQRLVARDTDRLALRDYSLSAATLHHLSVRLPALPPWVLCRLPLAAAGAALLQRSHAVVALLLMTGALSDAAELARTLGTPLAAMCQHTPRGSQYRVEAVLTRAMRMVPPRSPPTGLATEPPASEGYLMPTFRLADVRRLRAPDAGPLVLLPARRLFSFSPVRANLPTGADLATPAHPPSSSDEDTDEDGRESKGVRTPGTMPPVIDSTRWDDAPVAVLDFRSLYPSVAIAYNYCYSTCLGRLDDLPKPLSQEPTEIAFGCGTLRTPPPGLLRDLMDAGALHISPTGVLFAAPAYRRGVLPVLLASLLQARQRVRRRMRVAPGPEYARLDARQRALKMVANLVYGYTGARATGRAPCTDVADAIVGAGRWHLDTLVGQLPGRFPEARVLYGDTDSVFVLAGGGPAGGSPAARLRRAMRLGARIEARVSRELPAPMRLVHEKVYWPCALVARKRYAGRRFDPGPPSATDGTSGLPAGSLESRGLETIRRDACPAAGRILHTVLCWLFAMPNDGGFTGAAIAGVPACASAPLRMCPTCDLPLKPVFGRVLPPVVAYWCVCATGPGGAGQLDLSDLRRLVAEELTRLAGFARSPRQSGYSLHDFSLAQRLRPGRAGACRLPGPSSAARQRLLAADPRAAPALGDRFPVVILRAPGPGSPRDFARLYGTSSAPGRRGDLPLAAGPIASRAMPLDRALRHADHFGGVDMTYYIERCLLPPLARILSLVGVGACLSAASGLLFVCCMVLRHFDADIFAWYSAVPRPVVLAPPVGQARRQGTPGQRPLMHSVLAFIATGQCAGGCGETTTTARGLCGSCSPGAPGSAGRQLRAASRYAMAQRRADRVAAEFRTAQARCRDCMGLCLSPSQEARLFMGGLLQEEMRIPSAGRRPWVDLACEAEAQPGRPVPLMSSPASVPGLIECLNTECAFLYEAQALLDQLQDSLDRARELWRCAAAFEVA
ncbi:hypothetical protein, variant 2 [Fonticula alba]|nr:hypothetical protein, variant 2 [Fonticula alba]KCV72593.1 hypothetical protein, variant 2 [Fonticula alba]|eukprot:XP_009492292.1 hypothetical protein, variant 2 [Fonticula alba]